MREQVDRNENGRRVNESHHQARLTNAEVEAIRWLCSEYKLGYKRIADLIDESPSTVRNILAYQVRPPRVTSIPTAATQAALRQLVARGRSA